MNRGPKPKSRAVPRAPLGDDVPKELTGRARQIYRALAKELTVEGYACRCDWRAVALVARTEALAERLEAEAAALASFVVVTDKGQRVHPLVVELRAVRAQLAGLYSQLLISPKARVSSRVSEDQQRQAFRRGFSAADDELQQFIDG